MDAEIKRRLEQIRRGEIPDGYKRTETGILPIEWEERPLSLVIEEHNEKTTIPNQYPVLTSARSGLMLQTDYYANRQVTTENNVGYNVIPYGYMTFRSRSDDGKFRFNQNEIIEKGIVSYFYPVFRFDSSVCQGYFLALLNHVIDRKMYRYAEGTAQQVLTLKRLGSLRFPMPPLTEQRAIAEVLSAQDTVIKLKERLLSEKRRQKKWLIQRLFHEFQGEQRKIKDVCNIIGGGTPDTRKAEYWNGEIAWCTPSDFSKYGTKYINDTEKRISKLGLESSSATMLPVGAVLLCTRATVGEARIAARPICTNQGFQSMVPNQGISNEWLYYLIQHIKSAIIKLAAGSTFLEISKTNLSNITISVPPFENQLKVADILSAADREINLLERELSEEKRKKKALSQLLLTGLARRGELPYDRTL